MGHHGAMPRAAIALVFGAAGLCLGVVAWLIWGALSSSDSSAVGDLPTVEEVVVAQAHRHGIELPELTEADRARLAEEPSAASTLSPYDQVLGQLRAVRDAAGASEALEILAEVASLSADVAADCPRLYNEIAGGVADVLSLTEVCPPPTP